MTQAEDQGMYIQANGLTVHPTVNELKKIVEGAVPDSQYDAICYGAMNTIDALRLRIEELQSRLDAVIACPFYDWAEVNRYGAYHDTKWAKRDDIIAAAKHEQGEGDE